MTLILHPEGCSPAELQHLVQAWVRTVHSRTASPLERRICDIQANHLQVLYHREYAKRHQLRSDRRSTCAERSLRARLSQDNSPPCQSRTPLAHSSAGAGVFDLIFTIVMRAGFPTAAPACEHEATSGHWHAQLGSVRLAGWI